MPSLSGPIDILTGLKALRYLELSYNRLSGPISAVQGLTKLTYLDLGANWLTGSIKAVQGLTELTVLSVAENHNLSGSIDAVANLTKLTSLYLYNDDFSGMVPAGPINWSNFGPIKSHTRSCVMTGNHFRCPLPDGAKEHCGAVCDPICKAADPALNLTKYSNRHVVTTEAQLKRVCDCTSIDYLLIGAYNLDCPTCTQETLDACRIQSITSSSAGFSLSIEHMPLISSLRGLSRLTGALSGSLSVYHMYKLATLDGLEKIASIAAGASSNKTNQLWIVGNPALTSATALLTSTGRFTSDMLYINGNPQLACVPPSWPAKDFEGMTIRSGKCGK
jgi:hypothetical protein